MTKQDASYVSWTVCKVLEGESITLTSTDELQGIRGTLDQITLFHDKDYMLSAKAEGVPHANWDQDRPLPLA